MQEKIFTIENVNVFINELKQELKYPYINIYHSTLGGNDNISILLTLSLGNKENWPSGILENSQYAKIHILNYGKYEYISDSIRIRKTSFKNIKELISKLNNIKERI